VRRETIPPAKWDPDLASTSEEIVKAERKSPKSMAAMQKKSLKRLEEQEKKMASVKKTDEDY
jgi:hypothetical protein